MDKIQTTDKQAELLNYFSRSFFEKFQQALKSGAVPDGTDEMTLGKCILQIAAEEYKPMSTQGKALLKNLRSFI